MQGNNERIRADRMAEIATKLDALGMAIKASMFYFLENDMPTDRNRVKNLAWMYESELQAMSEELLTMAEESD